MQAHHGGSIPPAGPMTAEQDMQPVIVQRPPRTMLHQPTYTGSCPYCQRVIERNADIRRVRGQVKLHMRGCVWGTA